MIGVDTNVLLRLFVDDDAGQHQAARQFFAKRNVQDPAFVPVVVLAELVWALMKRYGYAHSKVLELIEVMTHSADFAIEHVEHVGRAIDHCRDNGTRLTDVLVAFVAASRGCRATVTFDLAAAKRIPGMELLK
jgi:predicted nucleic-acid-binding protein